MPVVTMVDMHTAQTPCCMMAALRDLQQVVRAALETNSCLLRSVH